MGTHYPYSVGRLAAADKHNSSGSLEFLICRTQDSMLCHSQLTSSRKTEPYDHILMPMSAVFQLRVESSESDILNMAQSADNIIIKNISYRYLWSQTPVLKSFQYLFVLFKLFLLIQVSSFVILIWRRTAFSLDSPINKYKSANDVPNSFRGKIELSRHFTSVPCSKQVKWSRC